MGNLYWSSGHKRLGSGLWLNRRSRSGSPRRVTAEPLPSNFTVLRAILDFADVRDANAAALDGRTPIGELPP